MTMKPVIVTARLRLRPWHAADYEPFAQLNADPEVMAHFAGILSRAQSDALATRISDDIERQGFGFWAVEIPNVTAFAGFVGLSIPRFTAPFTPCVEIGWRLATAYWKQGYATEGAMAALRFGFERLRLPEIVAFTVPGNVRSRRVMEKLGIVRNPADDFDHPVVAEGHPLRRHVLYRVGNPQRIDDRRVQARRAAGPHRNRSFRKSAPCCRTGAPPRRADLLAKLCPVRNDRGPLAIGADFVRISTRFEALCTREGSHGQGSEADQARPQSPRRDCL